MTNLPRRRFELILIKPSHYDDDGYVIQWFRSMFPSNTLAVIRGLAADCAERFVLGEDVDIVITVLDEMNNHIRPGRIIHRIKKAGGFGLVGMVGVQTNHFPRALDIARPLREAGVQVVIGGFHVSGCLAMLPGMQTDLQRALDMGVTLFAGEAEYKLDQVLVDAANGTLKPIYNHLKDLPGLEGTPLPYTPKDILQRNLFSMATLDAGRGCPFQCSFCTIINVQGRKSRHRTPDEIEQLIRWNVAQGIYRFFITDDNFVRNKDWEAILDRVIKLREEEGIEPIRLSFQVDTQCQHLPNFMEKARRANVFNMFIGLENIDADNLIVMKKRQNKITDYRALFLACKKARILTTAGYILGFPNDTAESITRDIEIIKRELATDMIYFTSLTPLPGSEDHQKLAAAGVWMDPDMNKYDTYHVVTGHSRMSKEQWEEAHKKAWETYYTPDHIVTTMRRCEAFGLPYRRALEGMVIFSHFSLREGLHPAESGLLRIKRRRDRRPGLPRENPLVFYPRYWFETVIRNIAVLRNIRKFDAIGRQIAADPERTSYMDRALMPVTEEDDRTLDLLTHSASARAAVEHHRKI